MAESIALGGRESIRPRGRVRRGTETGILLALMAGRFSIASLFAGMAALAVAATMWGCGGGDDSATGNGGETGAGGETTITDKAPPTQGESKTSTGKSESGSGGNAKAEFVKRAEAICTEGKKQGLAEVAAYAKKHASGSPQGKAEALFEAVQKVFVPRINEQIDEIRALDVPPGDEAQVNALLDAMQEGVDNASGASPSSSLFSKSFAHSGELAREYGIEACAYG